MHQNQFTARRAAFVLILGLVALFPARIHAQNVVGVGCDSMCDSACAPACVGGQHRLENWFAPDRTAGSYWAIHGGWNSLDEYTGIDLPAVPLTIREGSFKDGWAIGGAIGRRINRALRAEVEYTFRDNTADEWTVNQVPVGDWDGHFNNFSVMTNLYHDFARFDFVGWKPYVGGGVGIAFLDGEFNTASLALEVDESAFAFQLMAGASKKLSDRLDAFIEYRFTDTDDFDLVNLTAPTPVQFGEDPYQAQSVFVGFRLYR